MSGKGDNRRHGKGYGESFDRIFGKEHKPSSGRVIIDKRTGKTVKVFDVRRGESKQVLICGDIEPFISPVTGKSINSRSELRQHNKEHGVTDSRDYSAEFMRKKTEERCARALGQTKEDKARRIKSLVEASEADRYVPNKGRW